MNTTLVKKEVKESFYVSKGIWWLIISALIFSILCLLTVSIKELGFLAQTELIQYAAKIGLFLSFLVTMVLGSSTFVAEREESTLESLMLAPISKFHISFSKLLGVLLIGIFIYLVSAPYIIVLGFGTGLVLRSLLFMIIVGGILLIAYGCISVTFSILIQTSKASILISIMALLISAAPAFMGGLLNTTAFGRIIVKISPISNSFNLLSAMTVEQQSISYMIQYFIPIVLFVLLSGAFLVFATKKIAFKEGE